MNCLNNFLIDGGAETRARARVNLKSRPKKLKMAKPSTLEAILLCIVDQIGAASLFSSLKIVKLSKKFLE